MKAHTSERFGKVVASFLDSTINELSVETRFVFIMMIVLSEHDGRLDMTRQALARRLNVDLDVMDRAISDLESPDEFSRSTDYEGRRIIPLESGRSWGWIVVNKAAYRSGDEARRAQDAERQRRKRQRDAEAGTSSDSDTDTEGHVSVTKRHVTSRDNRGDREKEFEERWAKYPKKSGKKAALGHYLSSVKTAEDRERFDTALANAVRMLRDVKNPQYIPNGSTFFNNWQDEHYAQAPAQASVPGLKPMPAYVQRHLQEKA